MRTGNFAATGGIGNPGFVNCGAWSSSLPGDRGTVAGLPFAWDIAASVSSPWSSYPDTCNLAYGIWCVER